MAVINQNKVYDFKECVTVQGDATAVTTGYITVLTIPARTVITDVIVVGVTPGVGASNFSVGVTGTPAAFILAHSAVDAVADHVIGDLPSERGSLLFSTTIIASATFAAATDVIFTLSATETTYLTVKIILSGYRY